MNEMCVSLASFDEELLDEEAETHKVSQVCYGNSDLTAQSTSSLALVKETVEEPAQNMNSSKPNSQARAHQTSSQN